ncbi:MAG: hypoxanthine phosphoribosyltransferase [bacterium]
MNDKNHSIDVLISEQELQEVVQKLAKEIYRDFNNQEIILVGVLDGSFAVLADLAKQLHKLGMDKIVIDFMGIDTYGSGTKSSKEPRITKDLKHDIKGKVVVIVEDIVDTGYSLSVLQAMLSARLPQKLATLSLLSKDERREIEVPVEYIGKHIPNVFVVGYGLDFDGKYYRELPYIGVVKFK